MLKSWRSAGVLFALLTGCSIDSGGTAGDLPFEDTGEIDTSSGDTLIITDEGVPDTGITIEDSPTPDTTPADTSVGIDTSVVDTGLPDTTPIDTGIDTGVIDTAPETPVSMPVLTGESGQVGSSARKINIATEGTIDWAHWGHGGVATTWNRKAGGTALIKGAIGLPSPWGSFPTEISWTGGTPTPTATDSNWGIYHDSNGDNFAFDATGDPAVERTLRVYVTWNDCTGTVEAKLSDATLSWTGLLPPPGGSGSGIQPAWYQFKFRPAASGGKLQIKVTKTNGGGYMGIVAATLR